MTTNITILKFMKELNNNAKNNSKPSLNSCMLHRDMKEIEKLTAKIQMQLTKIKNKKYKKTFIEKLCISFACANDLH